MEVDEASCQAVKKKVAGRFKSIFSQSEIKTHSGFFRVRKSGFGDKKISVPDVCPPMAS